MSHMDLGHHGSDINFMHEDSLDMHIGRLGRDYDNITNEKLRFVRNQENNLSKKSTQLELMGSEKIALQKQRLELTSNQVRKHTGALDAFLNKRLLEIKEMRDSSAKHKEFISRIKRDIRHNREEMKRLSHIGGATSLVAYRQRASHKVVQMKSRLQTKQKSSDKLALERRRLRGLIMHEIDVRGRFKESFEHSNMMAKGDADRILENVDMSVDAFEETNRLQHKFHALKDKHQRDSRHLGQRIKDIERILNSERDLKSFLCAKNKRRVPGGEGGSGVSKRLVHALRNYEASPQLVESLLMRIKAMTKESSPYGMVRNFQQREATIMSMLSYVTNASKEIEDTTNHLEVMLVAEEDLVARKLAQQETLAVQDATEADALRIIQQNIDTKVDRIARREITTKSATEAVRQLCTDLVDRVILLPRPSAAASGSRGGNIYPDFLDDVISNNNLYDILSVLENRVNDVRTKFDYLMLQSEHTKTPIFHPDDEENRLPHNKLHFARDLKSPAATAEIILTNDDDVDEAEGGRRKLKLKPPNILESASMCDKVIDDDMLSPFESDDETAAADEAQNPPVAAAPAQPDGGTPSLKVRSTTPQPQTSANLNKSSALVLGNAESKKLDTADSRQVAASVMSVESTATSGQAAISSTSAATHDHGVRPHHVQDRSDLRDEVFGPKDDASGQRLQPVHESPSVIRIRSMSLNPQQPLPNATLSSNKDDLSNKPTNSSYAFSPRSLPTPTITAPALSTGSDEANAFAFSAASFDNANKLSVSPSSSRLPSASNSAIFLEPLADGQIVRDRSDDVNEIDGWSHDEFITHLAHNVVGLTNSQLTMHDEPSTALNIVANSVHTAVRRLTNELIQLDESNVSGSPLTPSSKTVPQLALPNYDDDSSETVGLSPRPSPTTNFVPILPAGEIGRTRGEEVEWQPDNLARLDNASPSPSDDGRSSPVADTLPVGKIDRQRDFSIELSDIDLSAAVLNRMNGVRDDDEDSSPHPAASEANARLTAGPIVDDAISIATDTLSINDDTATSRLNVSSDNRTRRKTNTLGLFDDRLVDAEDVPVSKGSEINAEARSKRSESIDLQSATPAQSKLKLGLSTPMLLRAEDGVDNTNSVRQRDDDAGEVLAANLADNKVDDNAEEADAP